MTYWHYTFQNIEENETIVCGWSIQKCHANDFNFVRIHIDNPKTVILSVTQITKEQFDALTEVLEEINKKKEKRNENPASEENTSF